MRYTGPCSLPTTTITISPPSSRTFLVAAATDTVAPFLMAKANGTWVHLTLFMLPITSWSCFSSLCPSYGSVWILVKYGHSKQGSGAMSCLALYVQTIMRILKSLLSKEMRHNRFTKEISGENECVVFLAEPSHSQLREVTDDSSKSRSWSQKT